MTLWKICHLAAEVHGIRPLMHTAFSTYNLSTLSAQDKFRMVLNAFQSPQSLRIPSTVPPPNTEAEPMTKASDQSVDVAAVPYAPPNWQGINFLLPKASDPLYLHWQLPMRSPMNTTHLFLDQMPLSSLMKCSRKLQMNLQNMARLTCILTEPTWITRCTTPKGNFLVCTILKCFVWF